MPHAPFPIPGAPQDLPFPDFGASPCVQKETALGAVAPALGAAPAALLPALWECLRVTSDVRLRRLLAVAALLAGFGVALPRFLTHGPYPRLGARIVEGGIVQSVLGPPARGTLAPGDRLVSLNGEALEDPEVR